MFFQSRVHTFDRQKIDVPTLEQYYSGLEEQKPVLNAFPGIWRYLGMCKYNVMFLNKEFYTKNPMSRNFIQSEYEDNRSKYEEEILAHNIVHDIMRWCMRSDICTQTGLNFSDIMDLDFATYVDLKKEYDEMDTPRRKALEDMRSNTQQTKAQNQHQQMLKARMEHERKNAK